MGTAAAIVGGGAVVSSLIGARGSKKAGQAQAASADRSAQLQAEAAERALEFQQERFAETKELLSPFVSGGVPAFQRQQALAGALGPQEQAAAFQQFVESPGTEFLRTQGLRGIDRQLAARGGLGGSSRLQAISEFNQGLALQDLQNQFNRLGAVTGVGLGAAQALAGAGQQAAAGQAQTVLGSAAGQAQALQAGGAAQAQGILGRTQAFQSGLSDLATLGGFAALGGFNRLQPAGQLVGGIGPITTGGIA